MRAISDFCDQAACFLIDPLNHQFSPGTQRIACVITVLFGILTLGMAQAVSALWRNLRPIEEENETHAVISELFRKAFGENKHQDIPDDKDEFIKDREDAVKESEEVVKEGEEHVKPFEDDLSSDSSDLSSDEEELPVILDEEELPVILPEEVNSPEPVAEPAVDIIPEEKIEEAPPSGKPPQVLVEKESQTEGPQQQIASSDLVTIRAALLYGAEMVINLENGKRYVIRYNQFYSKLIFQYYVSHSYFRPEKQFEIFIDQVGKITSLSIDQQIYSDPSEAISSQNSDVLHLCIKSALEKIYCERSQFRYSRSANVVSIRVIRGGLKKYPEFHLQKFSQAIEEALKDNQRVAGLTVSFLTDDLTQEAGIDQGGISRDFLDDLFGGLVQSSTLSFKPIEGTSLVLPHSKMSVESSKMCPLLDAKEKSLYQDIGKLIIYCYHSRGEYKKYMIGRRFDEALFNAALCLTAEEIDTPFEKLTLQTKLKMCQALLTVRTDTGMNLDYLKKRLDWLAGFDRLDDHKISEAASDTLLAACLPDDFTMNHLGDEPDLEKIKHNKGEFKQFLIASIFTQIGSHGQFGAQLAPIHAIAQGMKSLCRLESMQKLNDNSHWDKVIRPIGYQTFSNIVQGFLDRKKIADQIKEPIFFVYDHAAIEIEKKLKWLKEWIMDGKNGATEEELKTFLKFLTGSSSLSSNIEISVQKQWSSTLYPVPIAHTCSYAMELAPQPCSYGPEYNDHTKDNFIKCLKELALINASSFQIN